MVALVWVLVLGASFSAFAQSQKTLRMLIGFPAGQASDTAARVLAERLTVALGYPVIIDNRPGQGGSLALALLAKSPADGSVMTVSALAAFVANPHLYKSVAYDTLKDFDPVALILDIPVVLVTHPSVPARTVAELIAYAKANPDRLTHSSSGNGTVSHLGMEEFKRRAEIRMIHVPYQGSARAMLDLMAGNVQVAMDSVAVTQSHVQAGKMRLLAVASGRRMPMYPDVPTIAELGFPGYETVAWLGAAMPAGTPKEIRDKVGAEVLKIARSAEYEQRMTTLGMVMRPAGAEEFGAFLKTEYERWGRIVSQSGAKVE